MNVLSPKSSLSIAATAFFLLSYQLSVLLFVGLSLESVIQEILDELHIPDRGLHSPDAGLPTAPHAMGSEEF
jgi:hypothetical protein